MKLFFLSAYVPLTKTYARAQDGSIEKSPYPMVRDFTSHETDVESPADFCLALKAHAARGHCLLKGNLKRELHDESRAGATSAQDTTQWLCFDLDGITGFDSIEHFINQVLPASFHNVDYVLQHSASSGITDGGGIRAHVFFLASRPFPSTTAKHFVASLNFDNTVLREQLSLTAAGTALKFPLDRTVNQPDKLIYISAPVLGEGLTDPLGDERIQLIERGKQFVDFDVSAVKTLAQVEAAIDIRVNELRTVAGLPRRKPRYAREGGEDILTNPDRATVTGEKRERGYVYLNLNGGDSWGYFYPEGKPTLLYNFKGEPVVRLADIAPDYAAAVTANSTMNAGDNFEIHPFCFRQHETDTIHAGLFDSETRKIVVPPAQITRANLTDFFASNGGVVPDPVEDWTYEFRPQSMIQVDVINRFCNMWTPTDYMKNDENWTMPPTIDRVLRSVVGDDEECYQHFINWIACIFQDRIKTGTAWVLHGVPGTGKGVLFHEILRPLFGERYCVTKTVDAMLENFNGDLKQALIVNIDEANTTSVGKTTSVINKLKNLITEPVISIREMRANAVQMRNYTNFIFTSNDYDALTIQEGDRRLNVAPRQEHKIHLSEADIANVRAELDAFAGYLNGYAVSEDKARTAINNKSKQSMREAGQDALEQMCQAITDGNLAYFFAFAMDPDTSDLPAWSHYQQTVLAWTASLSTGLVVTATEMRHVYKYLMAPPQMPGPQKFARMLAHKNILSKVQHCPQTKKTVRGTLVEWKATPEQLEEWKGLMALTVKQPRVDTDTLRAWTPSQSACN